MSGANEVAGAAREQFYRAFEDRYRGERAVIKARLGAYRPFLDALATLTAQRPAALDLGCGRGEWLELLGERGFAARGVDLDAGMLAACRERALDVDQADAIASLRAQPDASLTLVSAFHLVEHIPFDVLQTLIAEALRVLRPGGLLIMETPNPENLSVGATSFYLDPSHERPLPPLLLGFLSEHAGFARQLTVRLQEDARLHDATALLLIDVLEGVSPDYAIVAQKAATPAQLAPFDAAFGASYGLGLGQAAERYEQAQAQRRDAVQAELGRHDYDLGGLRDGLAQLGQDTARGLARIAGVDQELKQLEGRADRSEQALAELHTLAARTDARIGAGEAGVRAAEERAEHTRAQVEQTRIDTEQLRAETEQLRAEAALARAEAAAYQQQTRAEAAAYQQHIAALLASSSWRLTAPWRRVGAVVHRARGAWREGRIGSGLRRRLKPAVLALMRAVLRRPALKRAARAVLQRMPGQQARLQALLYQQAAVAPPPPEPPPQEVADLSPRAQRMYRALQRSRAAAAGGQASTAINNTTETGSH